MKPIPKIIELARKLYAAGYRKKMREGDWGIYDNQLILILKASNSYLQAFYDDKILSTIEANLPIEDCIPIPTLTNCLTWLAENGHHPELWHHKAVGEWVCQCNPPRSLQKSAPTPTEAAYLAMIKILEEE